MNIQDRLGKAIDSLYRVEYILDPLVDAEGDVDEAMCELQDALRDLKHIENNMLFQSLPDDSDIFDDEDEEGGYQYELEINKLLADDSV